MSDVQSGEIKNAEKQNAYKNRVKAQKSELKKLLTKKNYFNHEKT